MINVRIHVFIFFLNKNNITMFFFYVYNQKYNFIFSKKYPIFLFF